MTVERFLGLMTDLTQAVAGRLELMLDGNQLMTEDQALPVAKGLDRLGWTWFEEPLPTADIDGYARLNAAVDLPITGGEQLTTLEQFLPYFEAGAYSIAQPDVAETGLAEAFRIATVAADFGIDVCPHSWHNGLMAVTHAHYVAALPNPRVVELCMVQGPLQWGILADPPKINDGWMELPTDPGLGVRLADGLEARFPYIEGEYHVLVTR